MNNFNENFSQDLTQEEMDHHVEQEMDYHVEQEMDHHIEQEMDHHVEQEMDHHVEQDMNQPVDQEMDKNNQGKLFDLPIGARLFDNVFDEQVSQEENNYMEVTPEQDNLSQESNEVNNNTIDLSSANKIVWNYYPSEPYMEQSTSENFLNSKKKINNNMVEKTGQVTDSIKNQVNDFKNSGMEKIRNNFKDILNKSNEERKDLTDYIEEHTNTIIIVILILLILSFIFYKFN